MCLGGGSTPAATAPPPAAPAPAPVTIQRLKSKPKTRRTASGRTRRRGAARSGLVIKRTTGVQYTGSGTGVSV